MTKQTGKSARSGRIERKLHKNKHKEHADNPKKGVMWYLVYCCIKAIAMICSSILFDLNKDLQPFQMLFGRSTVALVTMILWLNCGLKKAVWNGVKAPQIPSLIFRST